MGSRRGRFDSHLAEATILSPSDRNAPPTPSQLERTALSLERKGNLRLLICVVEEWAELGDPSRLARLAQIRALLELCSFDRAWARLKELLDDDPDPEVFKLAGEVLIDRGEVKDARATLSRGRHLFPDDRGIQMLLDRADEPGTVLDLTDPLDSDPDGQTRVAERLLIEGAPLKARRILDRVLKSHPDHTRTADLIWALDGDFRLRGVTLADLARVHAQPTQSLTDLPEDTDQTMESDDPTADDDDDRGAAFPTLFKNLEEQTEAYGFGNLEREVTKVSAIVSESLDPAEITQETTRELTREDTQIMHVVRTTGHAPDASAADTVLDGKFDLRAHEQQLRGESEDENVVLHRRARPDEHTLTETDAGERIRLDPSRDRVQTGANHVDEGAEFIRPKKKPQVTIEPAPPRPKAEKPAKKKAATDAGAAGKAAKSTPAARTASSKAASGASSAAKAPSEVPTAKITKASLGAPADPAPAPKKARPATKPAPPPDDGQDTEITAQPKRKRSMADLAPPPVKRTPAPAPSVSASPSPPAPPPQADPNAPTPTPPLDRPRLTAAPSGEGAPIPQGVSLQRLSTDERPTIDPAFAAAPTEILEDADEPLRRSGLAPWTGWLLVLVLFGLAVLAMGSLLILYQVVTSM